MCAVHAYCLCCRVPPPSPSGAEDLSELQSHPFFEGIDWATLRSQPAPAFKRKSVASDDGEELGLDWELTSLFAPGAPGGFERVKYEYLPTGAQID